MTKDNLKVRCEKCGVKFWRNLGAFEKGILDDRAGVCCVPNCGGQLVESMDSQQDYLEQKFLNNN